MVRTIVGSEMAEKISRSEGYQLGPRRALTDVTAVFVVSSQRRADARRPGLNEDVHGAAANVSSHDSQLGQLQQEVTPPVSASNTLFIAFATKLLPRQCLATELATLAELLAAVESETLPGISGEHPEAECCGKSLRDGLDAVQLPATPLCCQLTQQLELPCKHQVKNTPHTPDSHLSCGKYTPPGAMQPPRGSCLLES